jgi:hypothetical protein
MAMTMFLVLLFEGKVFDCILELEMCEVQYISLFCLKEMTSQKAVNQQVAARLWYLKLTGSFTQVEK